MSQNLLTSIELQDFLTQSKWGTDEGKLFKVFSFTSYPIAAAFVQELAILAEEQNHHPEILLTWRKVSVWIYTHDANGLTALDTRFALATNTQFESLSS